MVLTLQDNVQAAVEKLLALEKQTRQVQLPNTTIRPYRLDLN